MPMITVTICGEKRFLDETASLADAIESYSPYGEEAVICRYNGQIIRSIDETSQMTLSDGDTLDIFPLIIGG